ncbi:MAG: hypothetical protein GX075_08015 [Firmicutes bacterium]|nr:hypothetical protein [Bacillota bacterium]
MANRVSRKVIIHIILIGIILAVVFMITIDLQDREVNQDQIPIQGAMK